MIFIFSSLFNRLTGHCPTMCLFLPFFTSSFLTSPCLHLLHVPRLAYRLPCVLILRLFLPSSRRLLFCACFAFAYTRCSVAFAHARCSCASPLAAPSPSPAVLCPQLLSSACTCDVLHARPRLRYAYASPLPTPAAQSPSPTPAAPAPHLPLLLRLRLPCCTRGG